MEGSGSSTKGKNKEKKLHPLAKLFFQISSSAVAPGWIAMAVYPNEEYTGLYIRACCLTITVMYIISLAMGGNVEGGDFVSLRGVLRIFRKGNDLTLNGCWLHYLIFDMIVGYSIALDASARGISQLAVAPFLFATLMFGPSGWAAFQAFCYYTELSSLV